MEIAGSKGAQTNGKKELEHAKEAKGIDRGGLDSRGGRVGCCAGLG